MSVVLSDIRGSIKGSTFQLTGSGLVLKNISKKPNKLGSTSLVVRSIMNNTQIEWGNIGQSNRDIWTRFSNYNKTKQKNSDQYILNGQQLFIRVNTIRKLYNLALLTVPEFSKCVILPVDIVPSLSGSDLFLTANRLINSNIEFLTLKATIPVRDTINNAGSRFKEIVFNTSTGTVFNVGTEYYNTTGAILQAGDTIFIRYTINSKLSGQHMPHQTKKVLLT
jgi:hypothetical protein